MTRKKGQRFSQEDAAQVVALFLQGNTLQETADAMGVTADWVQDKETKLRRMGVELPRRRHELSVDLLNALIVKLKASKEAE